MSFSTVQPLFLDEANRHKNRIYTPIATNYYTGIINGLQKYGFSLEYQTVTNKYFPIFKINKKRVFL